MKELNFTYKDNEIVHYYSDILEHDEWKTVIDGTVLRTQSPHEMEVEIDSYILVHNLDGKVAYRLETQRKHIFSRKMPNYLTKRKKFIINIIKLKPN